VLKPPPGAEPMNEPPTQLEQFAWMATKGTAWVMRRSTDLVPSLLAMAFDEWRAGSPSEVIPPVGEGESQSAPLAQP
jgi:hypothetical protein